MKQVNLPAGKQKARKQPPAGPSPKVDTQAMRGFGDVMRTSSPQDITAFPNQMGAPIPAAPKNPKPPMKPQPYAKGNGSLPAGRKGKTTPLKTGR